MRDASNRVCQVCGASGSLLHRELRDRLYGVPGHWSFRRCDNAECGLVWLDPKPLECDLHEAYADYFTHGDSEAEPDASGPLRMVRCLVKALEQLWLGFLGLRSARRRIECMYLEGIAPGRVLEVGCGDGRLLAALQNRGWEVEGQEVDPEAAGHTRRTHGVKVHLGDLHQLALPAESYDAVVMNHVIEHAHDPMALVRESMRLLKPGGLIVVTTPNPESFGHSMFGEAWRGLEPPRHLHLLPPRVLAAIARSAGFREAQVWTTPARAGGMLATSRDIRSSGQDRLLRRVRPMHLAAAVWYQLAARIAHIWRDGSGEEAVLRARR